MRPKRYPYSKSRWEKEVSNVYADGYPEPYATLVTHVNKITGEYDIYEVLGSKRAEARLEHGWVEVITQGEVITNQE